MTVKQKPKELDKFLDWLYDQYCREDIDFLDNEHIKLVKRHLKSLLTHQRTELLEEIKKLESLKEDKFFNHSNKTSEYFNRVSFYLNSLRKMIIKDIVNLLNKKDETN